ncbi:hypothetical protein [Cohaesibacter sp. ES.047]|nr:hypothetical protein [Cohaesibacter sp. ES.047]
MKSISGKKLSAVVMVWSTLDDSVFRVLEAHGISYAGSKKRPFCMIATGV